MSEVVETINNDVKSVEVVKKIYKTPEYVSRANKKYYEKKKNDPEYIKQELEKKLQRKDQRKLEKEQLTEHQQIERVQTCPDYIKRAVKNYNDRNKTNPEFIQKKKESQQKYREANRERLKEEARIRYHNKKLEKQKEQSASVDVKLAEQLENTILEDIVQIPA